MPRACIHLCVLNRFKLWENVRAGVRHASCVMLHPPSSLFGAVAALPAEVFEY
jgi:hypothetical protein